MVGKNTDFLLSKIFQVIINSTEISKWSERFLIQVGYAFQKLKHSYNTELLHVIGNAIVSRDNIVLNAQDLGNLAACFCHTEVSSSQNVLKIICEKFQSMDKDNFNLGNIADVAGAMCISQRLKVASPTMLELVVKLAISKSDESRAEDVRDILLGLHLVDLPDDLWKKLLVSYQPYFCQHSKNISHTNCSTIHQMYEEAGI